MTKRIFFAALVLVVAAAWSATLIAASEPSNPFARAARSHFTLRGHVDERLPAGGYVYLRVRDAGGQAYWVATMAAFAGTSDDVSVTVLARARSFASPRLHRTFRPLLFGTVSAAPLFTSNKENR